jgi:hypothetical protein
VLELGFIIYLKLQFEKKKKIVIFPTNILPNFNNNYKNLKNQTILNKITY